MIHVADLSLPSEMYISSSGLYAMKDRLRAEDCSGNFLALLIHCNSKWVLVMTPTSLVFWSEYAQHILIPRMYTASLFSSTWSTGHVGLCESPHDSASRRRIQHASGDRHRNSRTAIFFVSHGAAYLTRGYVVMVLSKEKEQVGHELIEHGNALS